jgi:hypothetical protein
MFWIHSFKRDRPLGHPKQVSARELPSLPRSSSNWCRMTNNGWLTDIHQIGRQHPSQALCKRRSRSTAAVDR